MKIGKYTLIGVLLDLFDFIGLGLVPIIGDIADLFAMFFWYTRIGVLGLTAGVELFPFIDLLPTNIVLGFLADQWKGKRKVAF